MQILVADNTDHTRSTICQLLETEGYNALSAASADEALRILREQQIGVVILDLVLVGMDSFELLQTIKSEQPHCEVITVTSFPSLDSVIKSMHIGAFDYLVKTGSDFDSLSEIVNRAADKNRQSMQSEATMDKLQREIDYLRQTNQNMASGIKDQHSGLYDASFFDQAFDSELNRASENQRQFSIVMVRLNPAIEIGGDDFQVRAMDSALPSWSRSIQERLRKTDIVARYDDHTLSIILPETGKEGALLVAECLIQLCDEVTQAVLGQEIEIADLIQVGIASFPDDGDNKDRLYDLANRRSEDLGSGTLH